MFSLCAHDLHLRSFSSICIAWLWLVDCIGGKRAIYIYALRTPYFYRAARFLGDVLAFFFVCVWEALSCTPHLNTRTAGSKTCGRRIRFPLSS